MMQTSRSVACGQRAIYVGASRFKWLALFCCHRVRGRSDLQVGLGQCRVIFLDKLLTSATWSRYTGKPEILPGKNNAFP